MRNNQRRSRARRREYVAELERKIHECEAEGTPARCVVPEDTIRRLQEENRKLRELLQQAGIEQSAVDQHLKDCDTNDSRKFVGTVAGDVVVSAGLQLPPWIPIATDIGVQDGPDLLQPAALPEYTDELFADSFLSLPGDDFPGEDSGLLFETSQEAPAVDDPILPHENPLPVLCAKPSSSIPAEVPNFFCSESSLPATSQRDAETTSCSDAYEMLRQHNKKGVDMIEIGIRLWNGFTKGDERGCKVENKLLFSVLEYVSG